MSVPAPTRELPRVSPELLFFLAGAAVERFAVIAGSHPGSDLYVVPCDGKACTLTPQEWEHYRAMCCHAADTVFAREGLIWPTAA